MNLRIARDPRVPARSAFTLGYCLSYLRHWGRQLVKRRSVDA